MEFFLPKVSYSALGVLQPQTQNTQGIVLDNITVR